MGALAGPRRACRTPAKPGDPRRRPWTRTAARTAVLKEAWIGSVPCPAPPHRPRRRRARNGARHGRGQQTRCPTAKGKHPQLRRHPAKTAPALAPVHPRRAPALAPAHPRCAPKRTRAHPPGEQARTPAHPRNAPSGTGARSVQSSAPRAERTPPRLSRRPSTRTHAREKTTPSPSDRQHETADGDHASAGRSCAARSSPSRRCDGLGPGDRASGPWQLSTRECCSR